VSTAAQARGNFWLSLRWGWRTDWGRSCDQMYGALSSSNCHLFVFDKIKIKLCISLSKFSTYLDAEDYNKYSTFYIIYKIVFQGYDFSLQRIIIFQIKTRK
jgi:hypothetical protein